MGWSCRKDAGDTMDRWTEFCVKQTGSQNTYESRGSKYFWEASRTEHADGAITGTVFKMVDENRCKRAGSFRINGDGTVARYPTGMTRTWSNAV